MERKAELEADLLFALKIAADEKWKTGVWNGISAGIKNYTNEKKRILWTKRFEIGYNERTICM